MNAEKILVLGAGAWGTALAAGLAEAGEPATIWARERQVAEALRAGRGNPLFLPGVDLPAIPATTDLGIVADAAIILAVAPAQFSAALFAEMASAVRPGTPILLCAKGVEQQSLRLMTDVMAEAIPHAVPAVLSGPSFAADVARGLPTAVTLAVEDEALGAVLMNRIGRRNFRPYWSDDLIGAEVGGAVKNVLAIACGIVEGLALGRSAHAALISRGFAEMTRLGVAMGGRAETLAGLCGLGDLVLTCSSPQSRNMSFGQALGQGQSVPQILAARTAVTEGVATAPALRALADRHRVDMPICAAVDDILAGRMPLSEAIDALLNRPFRKDT